MMLAAEGAYRLAVDDLFVYFVDCQSPGAVRAVSKCGGPIVTLANNQDYPCSVTVDATTVYWTNLGTGTDGAVLSVPKSGGGAPSALASGEPLPTRLAVGADAVYWIDQGDSTIRLTSLGGVGESVLWMGLPSLPAQAIAVDEAEGFVYWTSADGKVRSTTLDGAEVQVLGFTTTPAPVDLLGIAFDPANVYWTDPTDGVVVQSVKSFISDGQASAGLVIGAGQGAGPYSIAAASEVYWTNDSVPGGGLWAFNPTDQRSGTIDMGSLSGDAPFDLALDRTNIYFTTLAGKLISAPQYIGF